MSRLAVLFLVLWLSACGPSLVQTDVTRFHQPGAETPKTFTILPEQHQRGSLEFERYATLAAAELQRQGWQPLPSSQQADAVVFLHWGLGAPRTVTWQSPSSVYTGMGWGTRGSWYGGGIGMPLGDPFPYWETRSATYIPKWANVEILEAGAFKAGDRRVLFEGRTFSESGGNDIASIMPYLLRALFTGFPGASGKTVKVSVPIE
jgi:hypothetical protein